ncbi:MAG: hypothetical protein R3A12_10140 [Ignavibacteria bacterium]
MKYLYKLLLIVFTLAIVRSGYSQSDSVTNTIANFNIINGTKFSFDIYTLRTTAAPFIMGNSSYIVKYNPGSLTNPILSNVNPKYTIGGISNSYDQMQAMNLFASNKSSAVQLMYIGGTGENISSDPGVSGYGERIATVTLDILQAVQVTVQWDQLNSAVVSNSNGTAHNSFNGILRAYYL